MINVNHEMYALELLSSGDTCLHRIHPLAKLLAAAVFIFTVVSFGKYDVARLAPYFFYPMLLMALSRTPHSMLYKRLLLALPFCLFIGVSNIALDRASAFTFGVVAVSYGVISFVSLLCKAYLCVMAALILIAVTRLRCLANELARLGVPNVLIVMLEVTYRYIGILINQAHSMHIAYSLRGPRRKGIAIGDMGPFVGQLLLKSFDRADRIYNAMKCRGYAISGAKRHGRGPGPFRLKDAAYLALVAGLCIAFRFFDVYGMMK
jgi:cobalt/nickel transport system permease protein